MRLPPCQSPKVGLRAAKWLIKIVFTNLIFCLSIFNVVLTVSQGRYPCTITMHPIRQMQWTYTKATSVNLMTSFLENNNVQQGLTNKLFSSYQRLLHGGKDFQISYITFNIFKNSIFFFHNKENKWKVTINFDNTLGINLIIGFGNHVYSIETITDLMCLFCFWFWFLYNSIAIV